MQYPTEVPPPLGRPAGKDFPQPLNHELDGNRNQNHAEYARDQIQGQFAANLLNGRTGYQGKKQDCHNAQHRQT